MKRNELVLIDLPTFPKGTISLSLFAVAAALKEHFEVRYLDINLHEPDQFLDDLRTHVGAPAIAGLKVSAQNFPYARKLSQKIREVAPATKILWGGEFPTLMKQECLAWCDSLVTGHIEPVAAQLSHDLRNGGLQQIYHGHSPESLEFAWQPDFGLISRPDNYFRFMGLPLETSRGCVQKCVFCMVHVMQKKYVLKSPAQLERELKSYKGKFVNIVDYNFGVEPQHVISVARAMKKARVAGWMAEMCLESLDNDAMLEAMSDSGCRMIYCGLESIDEEALRSVNKANTNYVENYERIIRKVQAHGIQIATGMILGLKGMDEKVIKATYDFFHRMGIIYTKLTFLTYNPGTKVHYSMRKTGDYTTTEYQFYDGNHLTYLPAGVSKEAMYKGAEWFIRKFYHPWNILVRAFNPRMGFSRRLEYVFFSYCYGEAYRQWLREKIFYDETGFTTLLMKPIRKNIKMKIAETLLTWLRKEN